MTYKDRNACSVDATSEAVYTLRISETESLGESECQGVVPSSGRWNQNKFGELGGCK